MNVNELYQDLILDHSRHPRCHGCVRNPNAKACLLNPLCGDQIELTLVIKEGIVEDIAFSGHGCSISQASASMMSDICKSKSVVEVRDLLLLFSDMMKGEKEGGDCEPLGDAVALEGVRKFSARIKCAMLPWEAIEQCCKKIEEELRN
ncbi:SUF system NifU family Fe-S cluster assembly protein [Oligoflexia bacterium]|nr:SUF system NifU family Fe-S cluster assembly protein [Oligoflexia bacterium]